jgi:hypothetical protein
MVTLSRPDTTSLATQRLLCTTSLPFLHSNSPAWVVSRRLKSGFAASQAVISSTPSRGSARSTRRASFQALWWPKSP